MKAVIGLWALAACTWAQEGTGPYPAVLEVPHTARGIETHFDVPAPLL